MYPLASLCERLTRVVEISPAPVVVVGSDIGPEREKEERRGGRNDQKSTLASDTGERAGCSRVSMNGPSFPIDAQHHCRCESLLRSSTYIYHTHITQQISVL